MNELPVYFSPKMVADSGSYSPSAAKPLGVVASWRQLGLPLVIHEPRPVGRAELRLAHDAEYVDAVLRLERDNGFGNRSGEVAASLPYTTGAMLEAAREARRSGLVAIAPCSGFHHATWRSGADFCTFNGLMVTAAVLNLEGARKVGILDCDMHFGDGTEDIIAALGRPAWVQHFTAGAHYQRRSDAARFFKDLPALLEGFADCDVVLYQAGADPHVDDPLGGWLTTEQLRERDLQVFEGLRSRRVPVAWNLAGGYQRERDGSIPKVLAIHDNTLRACAEVFLAPSLRAS